MLTRTNGKSRLSWGLIVCLCGVAICGCHSTPRSTDNIDQQLELLLPQKVEILPFTKPRSWDKDDVPDGLEVVLRPLDAFGDQTKAVGMFRFELYLFRKASADQRGQRIGFWEVGVSDNKAQVRHWDAITRTYRFRLQWDGPRPVPGKYLLEATYVGPSDKRITDQYILQLQPQKPFIQSP